MLYNVDTIKQHICIVGKDSCEMGERKYFRWDSHQLGNWCLVVRGAIGIFVCLTCKKALESIYDVAWLINKIWGWNT
jgi:hypothetical protein